MKTRLFAAALLLPAALFAQKPCDNFRCMMDRAEAHLKKGEFTEAFDAATAARHYTDAVDREASEFQARVLKQADGLRREALVARQKAVDAEGRAREALAASNIDRAKLRAARDTLLKQQIRLKSALDSVKILADKADTLAATFPDRSTYDFLLATALRYFEWDQIAQKRDYPNALTYFALARFFCPEDSTLNQFVRASQLGSRAEEFFFNGKLDSAAIFYRKTATAINGCERCHVEDDFERRRLEQIGEVEGLFDKFKKENKPEKTLSASLDGNWWTVPEGMREYRDIELLNLMGNPANFSRFPPALGAFSKLRHLGVADCPNIRSLPDWSAFPKLEQLFLYRNPSLFAIDLEKVEALQLLKISECSALTYVDSCETLRSLFIEKSPQVKVAGLLRDNKKIAVLDLSGLGEERIDLGNFEALKSVNLKDLAASRLDGLERNGRLENFDASRLARVRSLNLPKGLTSIRVNSCGGLTNLALPPNDSLQKILLYDCDQLDTLPKWRQFPNLKTIGIIGCDKVRWVRSVRKVKGPENIYLLNNLRVRTDGIHAGFGFDWGVKPSSVKLELERRLPMRNGAGDLGYKLVGAYVSKNFYDESMGEYTKTQGTIGGAAVSYYSPYRFYFSIGGGIGGFDNLLTTNTFNYKVVWLNCLGYQIAPYFLRHDKLSLNMDLYTVFLDFPKTKYYNILPSFGLTYYHTFGVSPGAHFIRPSDHRRHIVPSRRRPFDKENKKKIEDLPGDF